MLKIVFLIVDHVVEKDKFSDSNEKFYEVLSNSGLTAPTNSFFKIKFLQLANTMGVLEEDGSNDVHDVLTKDDDSDLIQMVDSCPRCLSSNTLLNTAVHHMCREIPHSSGTTTIIASSSFEREFHMESCH